MKLVLFLCTGNYYRSRYAEAKFNYMAPSKCPGWTAASRGIAVDLGTNNVGPIARSTVEALRKQGIEFDPLITRMPLQLEVADLQSAHHIVALKQAEHLPLMQDRFTSWVAESSPDCIEYWHVHDIDQTPPDEALPLIDERLQDLMSRLGLQGGEIQRPKAEQYCYMPSTRPV